MSNLISINQLSAILPTAKADQIEKYLAPLNQALNNFAIHSPLRIAHFIAQLAQESMSFKYAEEIWPNPNLNAQGVATNGSSWQLRYEGRAELGNVHPGDGYKFRGRGLIQLTGRANYLKFGEFLQQDLCTGNNPDLVAQPALAVEAAGWFWSTRDLNPFADRDDILSITKRINGGTLGLDARKAFLVKAKEVLLPV